MQCEKADIKDLKSSRTVDLRGSSGGRPSLSINVATQTKGLEREYEIDGQKWIYSGHDKKMAFAISVNIREFVLNAGLNNVGFLTLTFADEPDFKESSKRFNSLLSGVFRRRGWRYMWVAELQLRGVLHYHVLVDFGVDIRTGTDVQAIRQGRYYMANYELRKLWRYLRFVLPRYGFGRHQLEPIMTTEEAIGRYLGKYLDKSFLRPVLKRGFRRAGMSQGLAVANSRFVWRSSRYRHFVAEIMGKYGITDSEMAERYFGRRWQYQFFLAFLVSLELS